MGQAGGFAVSGIPSGTKTVEAHHVRHPVSPVVGTTPGPSVRGDRVEVPVGPSWRVGVDAGLEGHTPVKVRLDPGLEPLGREDGHGDVTQLGRVRQVVCEVAVSG